VQKQGTKAKTKRQTKEQRQAKRQGQKPDQEVVNGIGAGVQFAQVPDEAPAQAGPESQKGLEATQSRQ